MSVQEKKELNIFSLTSLGLGAIIGSGIFAVPASMGAVAGPGLLLAIVIAGIITIFLALPYAELGAAFPIEGGPYAFPKLAMGKLTGFLMGWGFFLYLFIGTAAIMDIFIVYLGFYIPGLAHGGTLTHLGVTIGVVGIWIFTIINIFGVKWGSIYNIVTTIGKIIPLILFVIIGFLHLEVGNFTPFMPYGISGVTIATTLFFWSYTGFEALVVPTDEIKKPSITIPWAMILTILITIVLYVIIAFVFVGIIDWQQLGYGFENWEELGKLTSPLSDVASAVNLPILALLAMIGAVIATGGQGGSWVLIQGRMPHAMAKDKLFWSLMGRTNKKYQTPAYSLIFTSVLTSIIMIAIPDFPSVAMIASCVVALPYAAAVLAVPILRITKSDVERHFKLPWHYVFTVIGFIFSSFLIYWASWPWSVIGAGLFVTGYLAFFLIKDRSNAGWGRSMWIPVYLIGICIISLIGDKNFHFNNFTSIEPLNYLPMPYDLIVIAIFSILIYLWGFHINVKKRYIEKGEKISHKKSFQHKSVAK